jgi:hypothetical protein
MDIVIDGREDGVVYPERFGEPGVFVATVVRGGRGVEGVVEILALVIYQYLARICGKEGALE